MFGRYQKWYSSYYIISTKALRARIIGGLDSMGENPIRAIMIHGKQRKIK